MQDRNSLMRMNWPYVLFVVAVATAGLGFIAWSVTAQAVTAWSAGEPVRGGLSWTTVCITDGLAVATLAGLLWKVYRDAHTQIGAHGISQPSLRGKRDLAWTDVRRLEIFQGVGWHVYGPAFRIVVSPYAYRGPRSVIAALHQNIDQTSR